MLSVFQGIAVGFASVLCFDVPSVVYCGTTYAPLLQVDISLLADQVGITTTDTLDVGLENTDKRKDEVAISAPVVVLTLDLSWA